MMKIITLVLFIIIHASALSLYGEKPNVLFIICDDLNSHVSTSGYEHIRTPNLDKLATKSRVFNRAYCQYPVCGPSRASLLHSLYPQSTGVLNNNSDIRITRPQSISLPGLLKNQGYWTGSVGKIFHNEKNDPGKNDPGKNAWDQSFRFKNELMPIEIKARKDFEEKHGSILSGKARRLWKEHYPTIAPQTRNQHVGYGPSGLSDEQHKDGKNALQIKRWLKEKPFGKKPFFMALGIQKPHVPFLAPDKYFDLYPKEKLKFDLTPQGFWNQAPRSASNPRYKVFGFELGVENDSLRRDYMQAYHACVTFIDAQIGVALTALREEGLDNNTIVIFTSDHGYQLGEHFMWGKVTLFEECAKVPFMIHAPGITNVNPGNADALVELIDIYPTLIELCQLKSIENLHGQSLMPQLVDPAIPARKYSYTVVSRSRSLGKSIRTDHWRYARWPDGEELYHLKEDPKEYQNLIRSPEYTKIRNYMRSLLTEADMKAQSLR